MITICVVHVQVHQKICYCTIDNPIFILNFAYLGTELRMERATSVACMTESSASSTIDDDLRLNHAK